jgi:EAL domain-containing protein (putative c-di-GMP-specific phosphodiesterase class I)
MVPILRWRHPTAGMVMSDVFMSLLEDSGLILDVSRWQIRTVFQHIRRWIDSGVWKMRQKIFISLCEKQLRSPDFRDFLKNQLEEFKLGADQIILQVTERTTIRNLSLLQALTHELDGLGLCVHLSDFGNQYSSLSYLRQLNVEYLCLDQSFFLHMHLDHLETSIAKVIVDVAHRLGVDVMAIGADSSFKVEKMQALGCDTLVGDHFSAAIYPDEWPEYSKSHS